jgi:hypothetical protein
MVNSFQVPVASAGALVQALAHIPTAFIIQREWELSANKPQSFQVSGS